MTKAAAPFLPQHCLLVADVQRQGSLNSNLTPQYDATIMQDANKQWQFDILGFAEATRGYTLSLLGFYMLESQGLISEFGLDEARLCVYLRRIESGYDDTIPYHNRYRAPQADQQHIWLCCTALQE